MIPLQLIGRSDGRLTVLCLGAHADDIEIGCGGTILNLAGKYPACEFHWVVFSAIGVRQGEAQRGARLFTASARLHGPQLEPFRDSFMPYSGAEVKNVFEHLKQTIHPDLIFTHNCRDAHQDHRLVAELTRVTFRNHLILEYEVPKYDGDLGQPNLFVLLEDEVCQRKVRYIMDAFQSQQSRSWFQESTFRALMRLRGMECNAPSGYAEAFYCRKIILQS